MRPLNTLDREAWFEGPSAACEVTLAVQLGDPGGGKGTADLRLLRSLRRQFVSEGRWPAGTDRVRLEACDRNTAPPIVFPQDTRAADPSRRHGVSGRNLPDNPAPTWNRGEPSNWLADATFARDISNKRVGRSA